MSTVMEPPVKRGRPRNTDEAREVKAVLDSMTDDLREATTHLRDVMAETNESNIRGQRDIGKQLVAIRDDDSGKYGPDPLAEIVAAMPLSKDSIRPRLVIAESYTDEEFEELLDLHHPVTKEKLTWTHFHVLTRVKDKPTAFELAKKAVAHGWSTKDLNREVITAAGGPRSKGGRKVKKPDSLLAALDDIRTKTETWTNSAGTGWIGPEGIEEMYDKLASSPGWKPSDGLIDMLKQRYGEVETMGAMITMVLQHLNVVIQKATA